MSKSTSDPLQNINRKFCIAMSAAFAFALAIQSPLMTDEAGAKQKLENTPELTDIHITGGRWFGSGRTFRTCFEAVDINGKEISGHVSKPAFSERSNIIYDR